MTTSIPEAPSPAPASGALPGTPAPDGAADPAQGTSADAQGTAGDAGSYGSLGEVVLRLLNEQPDDDSYPSADEAFEAFLDWVSRRGIELWPHQEDALMDLAAGDNVILGTPTGSGKSMVALGMCFLAICTGRIAYYTAPIKALVSEKFFDLVDLFGAEYVGMITGDTHINVDAPIVCCTAEILANQALREGEGSDVGCVAMDEFHYFGDSERGWAWQVPLLTLPHTQFLLMSATLGDTSAIAASLREHTGADVDVIDDAARPVPLTYEFVDTALEGTVELALRKGEAPIYVVHFSQDAALSSAQSLASYGVATKEQREAVKQAIKGTRFTTPFGKILQRLLGAGVGVHHAGMLPRYRLLVEKLAQQGLLPVICGTDTLGVGINVPIHTVIFTALTKFDGSHMRKLGAREFHQIAGRAGRAGFDTEGVVIAEATEYDIENAKAMAKAGGDPKKARNYRKKTPPKGFVGWDKGTFERLIAATPATLTPRMKVTHSMVLAEVEQGGDARARVQRLIDESGVGAEAQARLTRRADEVFSTLIDAGVVERTELPDGSASYATKVDLPVDFALDQPLSPFLLEAIDLLDPESETYALDVVSMVEATLEDPRQILRVQERRARDEAMAQMKADGVEYDERVERVKEVTYPKPLEELLNFAFETYCQSVPWARDFSLSPKSVLRDLLETSSDFKGYVSSMGIARSEGTLLRYLSDAFRVLDRTIPQERYDERLRDIVSWLGYVVRSVDSSLVDEWEAAGTPLDAPAPAAPDQVVADRRALTVLVRNALFARVRLVQKDDAHALGALDGAWGFGERRWREALDAFYDAHEDVLTDADAHSAAYFSVDSSDERSAHVWHVHQVLSDTDGDHDFGIWADVDLDATQQEGEVVFKALRAGSVEDEIGA